MVTDLNKEKKRPNYVPTGDTLQMQGQVWAQSKSIEKKFHAHGKQKKSGVATLTSDTIDFKPKMEQRTKKITI